MDGIEKVYVARKYGEIEGEIKRLNNTTLLELETAIRKVGGKISRESTQREEESDKIVELYVNLSHHTAACLLVPSIFTGLLSLVIFAVWS